MEVTIDNTNDITPARVRELLSQYDLTENMQQRKEAESALESMGCETAAAYLEKCERLETVETFHREGIWMIQNYLQKNNISKNNPRILGRPVYEALIMENQRLQSLLGELQQRIDRFELVNLDNYHKRHPFIRANSSATVQEIVDQMNLWEVAILKGRSEPVNNLDSHMPKIHFATGKKS